jgi:hypothetical protein
VTVEFIDNRPYYVRAPHHHHHHHHHHDRRLHLKIRQGESDRDSDSSVSSADNEREVRPRAPHRHHDWHGKVIFSGDHDNVHVGRSPHHHHHHDDHHEHEKIIVSGDNDHVHVDRSVFIAGEQGQSYVVPHIAKRNVAQELFTVPSLRRRASDLDGVPGRIDIMVCILVNRP